MYRRGKAVTIFSSKACNREYKNLARGSQREAIRTEVIDEVFVINVEAYKSP
jgi:hypothetical protein